MARNQTYSHYYPKDFRYPYRYPFEKVKHSDPAGELEQTQTAVRGKESGCYFRRVFKEVATQPKSGTTVLSPEDLVAVPLSEDVPDSVLDKERSTQQIQEESKSDDATSIPDEESTEIPPLLEIELKTKDGLKRVEVRQGDDIPELVSKIAQENGLSKEVEAAIEYKVRKAMGQTGEQQYTLFK